MDEGVQCRLPDEAGASMGRVGCSTACAEFPSDNPALHRGALSFAPEAHVETTSVEPAHELEESRGLELQVLEEAPIVDSVTEPAPPVLLDEDGDAGDIEIVDDMSFDDAIDESPLPLQPVIELAPEPPPTVTEDAFVTFVAVLEDVASDAGADEAAMHTLRTLLGQLRIDASAPADHHRIRAEALAWQAVLRGETEDFGACGTAMLDEWSAALVALVIGSPSRADAFKRDLRRRGVAAFGLVDQAA
jgi:hypothetical protein